MYSQWVKDNVKDAYGNCEFYSKKMIKEFPELKMVRGHYHCPIWGAREHWWCVTEDGTVVDATASQFPTKGIFEYVELDESLPQPTGKCPNCGEYTYDHESVHKHCELQYRAYCEGA